MDALMEECPAGRDDRMAIRNLLTDVSATATTTPMQTCEACQAHLPETQVYAEKHPRYYRECVVCAACLSKYLQALSRLPSTGELLPCRNFSACGGHLKRERVEALLGSTPQQTQIQQQQPPTRTKMITLSVLVSEEELERVQATKTLKAFLMLQQQTPGTISPAVLAALFDSPGTKRCGPCTLRPLVLTLTR